jgi:hypothetical protein
MLRGECKAPLLLPLTGCTMSAYNLDALVAQGTILEEALTDEGYTCRLFLRLDQDPLVGRLMAVHRRSTTRGTQVRITPRSPLTSAAAPIQGYLATVYVAPSFPRPRGLDVTLHIVPAY